MTATRFHPHQPDDPGVTSPRQRKRSLIERLIFRNSKKGVSLAEIAEAHGCPLTHAEQAAARLKKEPEQRGA